MNKIPATITDFEKSEGISLVNLKTDTDDFFCFVINMNTDVEIKSKKEIFMIFKETEVMLLKGIKPLTTVENYFPCTIKAIEKGNILSRVDLLYKQNKISTISATKTIEKMNFTSGENIFAMVSPSEIALMEK